MQTTPEPTERLSLDDLREAWDLLVPDDRLEGFRALDRPEAENFFLSLSSRDQAQLLLELPQVERRSWLRLLAPDDAADVVQEAPREEWPDLLGLLDEPTRREPLGFADSWSSQALQRSRPEHRGGRARDAT